MPYSQKSALLYMAIYQNPHLVLVHKDMNDLLHLVFWTEAYGWHTPCGFPMSAAPMSTIKYGKPTCFGCLIDDEDPADVGRSERNCIKLHSEVRGEHVFVQVSFGKAHHTLVNTGSMTLREFEWLEFRASVVLGAKQLGMKVLLEE